MLLGAYWVLTPGSPKDKAAAFLARLDSQCPGWRQRDAFILQLDAEEWNSDPSTKPSLADCNTFCSYLAAAGKWVPVGYLPKWVYGSVAGFGYPVWASSYVAGSGGFKSLYPGDSSSRWASYGKPVTILQYTSSATIGGQTTCDANAYRGTLSQLKDLVTPGWSADMPLTDADLDAVQARVDLALRNWQEDDPDSTTTPPGKGRVGGWIRMSNQRERNRFDALTAQITALSAAVTQGADISQEDVQAIVTGVLTGLPAADIAAAVAAALPADEAKQVADELAARLQS